MFTSLPAFWKPLNDKVTISVASTLFTSCNSVVTLSAQVFLPPGDLGLAFHSYEWELIQGPPVTFLESRFQQHVIVQFVNDDRSSRTFRFWVDRNSGAEIFADVTTTSILQSDIVMASAAGNLSNSDSASAPSAITDIINLFDSVDPIFDNAITSFEAPSQFQNYISWNPPTSAAHLVGYQVELFNHATMSWDVVTITSANQIALNSTYSTIRITSLFNKSRPSASNVKSFTTVNPAIGANSIAHIGPNNLVLSSTVKPPELLSVSSDSSFINMLHSGTLVASVSSKPPERSTLDSLLPSTISVSSLGSLVVNKTHTPPTGGQIG